MITEIMKLDYNVKQNTQKWKKGTLVVIVLL